MPNGSYNIKGFWDEDEIQYLTFEIFFCKNTTENNNICLPQNEIENYFLEKDRFLSFFINDINIDVSNPNRKPFTEKFTTFYFLIDINLRKSYEVFLKETNLFTTEGFIFQETSVDKTFQFDSIATDINTLTKSSKNVGFINFCSSNVQTTIDRKYQDLQEAFSNFSGILNCIIFLALTLSNFENEFNVIKELIRNLYVFQDLSQLKELKQDKEKKKNDSVKSSPKSNFKDCHSNSLVPKELIQNKNKMLPAKTSLPSSTKRSRFIEKISLNSTSSPSNKDSFSVFKKLQKNFEFGFFKYLKMMLKFKNISLSLEEKLFLKAEKEIKSEMDIIEILKKLQELEKLKKILLDSNELYLFELLDKPYIFLEKSELNINDKAEKVEFRRLSTMTNHSKKINFSKNEIYDHYMKVKKSGSMIGQKILKLIDGDVIKFLDENPNNF